MDQSRAGWAGFAIQFVNGVQIGLTREVVYQVGHLAVDRTQAQRIARRRLSAKLRPVLMRRMKKNVAKDLPEPDLAKTTEL